MSTIESLVNDYYSFLKDNTVIFTDANSGWTQISTPLLNTFNDAIDLYAKQQNGHILLSDDGETLRNLELCGVSINRSPKRKELLQQILLNYGIKRQNGNQELIVEADAKNFPQQKFNLLSAIVDINNLVMLSKHNVSSAFVEDIGAYLDEQQLIYTPHFISRGSTGLEFTFDFQIASKKTELVIKGFNTVNSMNLPHFLFAWEDIKKVRQQQVKKEVISLAILNDESKDVKTEYLTALQAKDADYIFWSKRNLPESTKKLQPSAA
jgi:hypothetical protein